MSGVRIGGLRLPQALDQDDVLAPARPSTRDPLAPVDVVSRAATSEQLDAWRQIVEGKAPEPRRGRLIARGLVGLAAMGLAGWAWTRAGRKDDAPEGS